MSKIPLAWNMAYGRQNYRVAELHEQYGPVVRIAPTNLFFNSGKAWPSTYLKPPGKPRLVKDEIQFRQLKNRAKGLVFETDDVKHGRMRLVHDPDSRAMNIC